MTRSRHSRLLPLIALALTLTLAACGGQQADTRPEDEQPGTPLSLSVTGPASVSPGAEASLSATAAGTNGAAGLITWTAEAGALTPETGPATTWTAPLEPGIHTITATIEAGTETASDSISIHVTEDPPTGKAPLSISITGVDGDALLGVEYDLEALIEGTGAEEADVEWTVSNGALDTTEGRNVRWTAPSSSGPVWITATISGTDVSDTTLLSALLCWADLGSTQDSPCPITNVVQLQAIQEDVALHYALANDIDAAATRTWSEGFSPIRGAGFSGSLAGNGFGIDGLFINRPDTDHVALFALTERTALITDVRLTNLDVTGRSVVAGLVGQNGGTIRNAHVTGTVTATDTLLPSGSTAYAGGLVALNERLIEHSTSSASVTSNGGFAGGLVGFNGSSEGIIGSSASSRQVLDTRAHALDDIGGVGGLVGGNGGTIRDSYASVGRVESSGSAVGGLVGVNNRAIIERSFTRTAEVRGTLAVGGLVGENSSGTITQSYSQAGSVHGASAVGGLAGNNHGNSRIDESYSTSSVRGGTNFGGLIGTQDADSETTRSFWDVERSGLPMSAGGGGAIGVQTSEMHAAVTFMDQGWDLDEVWIIARDGTRPPELRGNQRPTVRTNGVAP